MNEETFDEIKKEIVQILVNVEIEYDKFKPETRKEAIQVAIENVSGIRTYGYPVSVNPIKAREVKR